MLTTAGKRYIKDYLAGFNPSIAQAISFGLGPKAEAVGDVALDFEVGRSDIALTSYDFINEKLIFKAPLPDDYAGVIYEVGLYSMNVDPLAGEYGSKILSSFDSDSEEWTPGVYTTANSRLGGDSLNHTPALSTSSTSTLNDIFLDFSGNSNADNFVVAFNNVNANTSTVKIRFLTDVSNYYEITITNPATGYVVSRVTKGTAVATGTPNWEDINSLEVVTTAKASGAASVEYDGIRIEDTDTINQDYVLISRELLSVPYVKEEGRVQEIEYSLVVTL